MSLDALFLPQIVCLRERVLKYMLLNFDRIFFLPNDVKLNAGHSTIERRFSIFDGLLLSAYGSRADVYYASMYAAEPTSWDDRMKKLMDTYRFLEEEGVCIPLQDEQFESPYHLHPLQDAVDADVNDAAFASLCEKYRNPKFLMPSPESLPNATVKGGGLMMRPIRYKRDKAVTAMCSERVNTALYYADLKQLVPVSDHPLFTALYGAKLQRAIENPWFLKEHGAQDQVTRLKISVLSWQLFSEVIPPESVDAKSAKAILDYKSEATELQERYRKYVRAMEAEVAAAAWDESLLSEVDKLVRRKVVPEIERISEQKKQLWERFFGEALEVVTRPRVFLPIVGATLIPTVSYSELLLYSTAATAALAALGGLGPKIKELVVEGRQLRRSALFFLLNFR